MPLPKPNADESHDDFMGRCMADETMREEYPDQDQRYAVCQSQWENKKSRVSENLDIDFIMEEIADEINRVESSLDKRLQKIESRQTEKGDKGDPGPRGERGEKGEPGLSGKDSAPGERGEKGEPGRDGKDGAQGERGEKGEAGPIGKDGLDGKDGKDGSPGEPGLRGEKGEAGLNGKDGPPGHEGAKGDPGLNGKDGSPGPKGEKGEDGKSVTVAEVRSLFEGEFAKWALEFERRAQDVLQKAIDRIPAPAAGKDGINGKDGSNGKDGRDGADGLGFDDLEVLQTGERGLMLRFSRDGKTKEFPFSFPVLIDRGVYKLDSHYQKGDGVTYAGSFWIAQKERPGSKPGEDGDWRLAVKRGRDARGET